MIVSDIRDFLEQLGYKVEVSGLHREHMALWREWYRGKVDSFHNYTVYNGVKEVKRTKKTLGMAKKSCEDWADLLLNERDVVGPNWKMNPPLREEEDRLALIEGLKSGALTLIANDHAPHSEEEKQREMDKAPFGIVSLESAFSLLYSRLVKSGVFTLQQLVYWMSEAPAKRFGMQRKGVLKEGYASDMILVDLDEEYIINRHRFLSKGKNTPFDGKKVYGKIEYTIVDGAVAYPFA